MIPVPREISAGCGLSWCADLKEREKVQEIMKRVGIEEEENTRMYGVKRKNRFVLVHNLFLFKPDFKAF